MKEGNTDSLIREVLAALRDELKAAYSSIRAIDVRVGLEFTGVLLSTGHGGVAYTMVERDVGCLALPHAGTIAGKPAAEVVDMCLSRSPVEAAIGVAAVNALSQKVFEDHPERYRPSKTDVLELIRPDDRVAMVGYFGPLIPKILGKSRKVYVLERRPVVDGRVVNVPRSRWGDILSSSDVILISGSTIVNKTLTDILGLVGDAREVVLLGPTASMIPEPLFRRGITAEMGVRIVNPEMMLRVVSEAGGARQLLTHCAEKIAFIKNGEA